MAEPYRFLLGRHGRLSSVLAVGDRSMCGSYWKRVSLGLLLLLGASLAQADWNYYVNSQTEALAYRAAHPELTSCAYGGSPPNWWYYECFNSSGPGWGRLWWPAVACPGGKVVNPATGVCACPSGTEWNGTQCVVPPPPECEPDSPAPYPAIDFFWDTVSCSWMLEQCNTERAYIFKQGWWSVGAQTCAYGCNYVADGATGDGYTWFKPGNVSCTSDELGPPEDPNQCGVEEELTAAGTCWPLPCPDGTESLNGACVYLDCPSGQIHWGSACVADCDWEAGEHMEEGLCLPPTTCGVGYTLVNSECVASEPPDYWEDPEPTPTDPPPGEEPWVPDTPPPSGGGSAGSTGSGNTSGSISLTPDGNGGYVGSMDLDTTLNFDWGDPGMVQGNVFDAPGFRESLKEFSDRVKGSDLVSSVTGLGALFPTGGVCPFGSVELFGTGISLAPACQYWLDVSSTVSFAAYAIWLLLAIRLFLEG